MNHRRGQQVEIIQDDDRVRHAFIPEDVDVMQFIEIFYPHIHSVQQIVNRRYMEDGVWTYMHGKHVFLPTGDTAYPTFDDLEFEYRFFYPRIIR